MPPKVDNNTAFALPDLTLENQKLIIPFSLGAKYHSDPGYLASFFQALIAKIEQGRISQITFVIADTLQAYNHLAIATLTTIPPALPAPLASSKIKEDYLDALDLWLLSNTAEIQAKKAEELTKGTAWLDANRTHLEAVQTALIVQSALISVHCGAEVFCWDECLTTEPATNKACANRIRHAYITDAAFGDLINNMIDTVSAQKISSTMSDEQARHIKLSCAAYIFEELAIIARWQQANRWDSMVYPFKKSPFNFQIFEQLKNISPELPVTPFTQRPLLLSPINAVITTSKQAEKFAQAAIAMKIEADLRKSVSIALTAPILIPRSTPTAIVSSTPPNGSGSPPEIEFLGKFAELIEKSDDEETLDNVQDLLRCLMKFTITRQKKIKQNSPPLELVEMITPPGSAASTSLLSQNLSLSVSSSGRASNLSQLLTDRATPALQEVHS